MDFKAQRKAVSAVESFGKKHKLLYPFCLLAQLFIKLFCSAVRGLDMALSDDSGRFLGLNRKCSRYERSEKLREKKIRRQAEKTRRKSVPRTRRGFFKRALSAVMSVAFAFMTMPAGLQIVSFADAGDNIPAATAGDLLMSVTKIKIPSVDQDGKPIVGADGNPVMIDGPETDYVTLNGINAAASGDPYAVYPASPAGESKVWTHVGNSGAPLENLGKIGAIDLTGSGVVVEARAFENAPNLTTIVIDAATYDKQNFDPSAFRGINPATCTLYIINDNGNVNGLNGFNGTPVRLAPGAVNDAGDLIESLKESANLLGNEPGYPYVQPFSHPADSGEAGQKIFVAFKADNIIFDGAIITYNGDVKTCMKTKSVYPGEIVEKSIPDEKNNEYALSYNPDTGVYSTVFSVNKIDSQGTGVYIQLYKNAVNAKGIIYAKGAQPTPIRKMSSGDPFRVTTIKNEVSALEPEAVYHIPEVHDIGDAKPYVEIVNAPKPQNPDFLKYYICYAMGSNSYEYEFVDKDTMRHTLKDLYDVNGQKQVYTPYFVEIFDPQNLFPTNGAAMGEFSLAGNVSAAIPGDLGSWHDDPDFSFKVSEVKQEIEAAKLINVTRNNDCKDTVRFTWATDTKATGCIFYIFDENGTVLEEYKYYNPESAAPEGKTNVIERTRDKDRYIYTFNYGAGGDYGTIAAETDVIYYDILPYETMPFNGDVPGDKFLNDEPATTNKHPYVNIDHYKLRTVANYSDLGGGDEPWIKLFWKNPAVNETPIGYKTVNEFTVKCYDADDNIVFEEDRSFSGSDSNREYGVTYTLGVNIVNGVKLSANQDYYFTVTAKDPNPTDERVEHYFTSRRAYAKAKNKPNYVGYDHDDPTTSENWNESPAARDDIILTSGNTEFYVKWPEVEGGADAYQIDVYNVTQEEGSLASLDGKVQNNPLMHVHSQVYPVTDDAMNLTAPSGASNKITATPESGRNMFNITIDYLNLLGALVKNDASYMVVITAINYGLGTNYNPAQYGSTDAKGYADQRPEEFTASGSSPVEDYSYENRYHYAIRSDRVLCVGVVVPHNVLTLKKPEWHYDDEHAVPSRGIELNWVPGKDTGIDGYFVERYITKDMESSYVPTNAKWERITTVSGKTNTSFVDTDYMQFYLDNNSSVNKLPTRYWYRIVPTYMQEVTGALSEPKYFDFTAEAFHMEPPVPIWSQGADGSIIIDWYRSALDNADGYVIYDGNGNVYANVYKPFEKNVTLNGTPLEDLELDSVGIEETLKQGYDHFRFVDKNLDFDQMKNYTITSVYYVAAVDPDEYRPSSARILVESEKRSITGVSSALRAPLNLEGHCDANGTITLTWTGNSGADYYNVYYSVNGVSKGKVSVPPTYYGDTGLFCKTFENCAKGDVYTFSVTSVKSINVSSSYFAQNKEAESEHSNEVTIVVGVAVQPPTLSAAAGDRRVDLTWAAVPGVDGYELYSCSANGENMNLLSSTAELTYTHAGLANRTTYYYRVRSFRYLNGSPVYSSYSPIISATPDVTYGDGETDPRYLAPPMDFTATTSDGTVNLRWTAVDGAEGYRVYMVNANGDRQLLGATSRTSASYSGLKNGEVYTYTVTAFKTLSDGELVESTYATPSSVTVGSYLAAPVDVTAVGGDRTVTLNWTAVTGATGYVVYAYSAAANSFTAIGVVSRPGFVHEGLENGLTYTYMITAYKTVGLSNQYSAYSLAVSAIPNGSNNGGAINGGNNNNNNNNNNTGNNNNNNTGNNNNNNNNINNGNNTANGVSTLNIVGTVPAGISHSELIAAFTDSGAFTTGIDLRFSVDTESSKRIYDTLAGYADGLESFDVFPFDISAYETGTDRKVNPITGHYVTVTMPVPDSFRKYGEDIQVMHITNSGQMEILPLTFGESGGIPLIQFSASEFSPFAVVHYLTPEDIMSASGAAASGASGAAAGSGYAMRFTSCGGFVLRKRNRVYKLIRR